MILVVNTSFPEVDQMAAAFAKLDLLSAYVRPYANLQRSWERALVHVPGLTKAYGRSFGRRTLPPPLDGRSVREEGVTQDMLFALASRLPFAVPARRILATSIMHARTHAILRAASDAFSDERAVVSSWATAELVFQKAKRSGALCVLNYPLAHHRFVRRYLLDEAERNPAFASTLNSHNRPVWLEARLDAEIELADHILVGSSFARDSFLSEGVPGKKLVVVPYGADTRLFAPVECAQPATQGFRLLFVGQVGQRKGISYLLDAVQRIASSGVTLTLVGTIQGDGSAFAPFRHLFRHISHVPRSELRDIYQHADLFVLPTLVEGMGIVVLEAMASGLPVITTPNGPGDIVRDGVDGFLVPPRDVSAIIDRVTRLRADPELRLEMARNARARAQEFTWEKYQARTSSLLREWLADAGGRHDSMQRV